jgi:hypothetical protein
MFCLQLPGRVDPTQNLTFMLQLASKASYQNARNKSIINNLVMKNNMLVTIRVTQKIIMLKFQLLINSIRQPQVDFNRIYVANPTTSFYMI